MAYERGSLGWWIDERRARLGLTWEQLAARADLSTETLFRAASGRKMRTPTRVKLERALEWENGSVERINAGEEPAENGATMPERDDDSVADRARRLDELERFAARLEDQARELRKQIAELNAADLRRT